MNEEEGYVEKNGKILFSTRQHYGRIIGLTKVDENVYEYTGQIYDSGETIDIDKKKTSADLLLRFITRKTEETNNEGKKVVIRIKIGEHIVSSDNPDLYNTLKSTTEQPFPARNEKERRNLEKAKKQYPYSDGGRE